MKSIFPFVLIIAAVGFFFTFTNPQYVGDGLASSDPEKKSVGVKEVQAEILKLNDALERSRQILAKRDALQAQFKKFSDKNLESIEKLLPDNVDNVQLILDINGIAREHGMALKGIKIGAGAQTISADGTLQQEQSTKQLGPDRNPIGSITLSFNVTASYDKFLEFIRDLEQSLRIVDVVALSFKSVDAGTYDYSVTIKTYWLK